LGEQIELANSLSSEAIARLVREHSGSLAFCNDESNRDLLPKISGGDETEKA